MHPLEGAPTREHIRFHLPMWFFCLNVSEYEKKRINAIYNRLNLYLKLHTKKVYVMPL